MQKLLNFLEKTGLTLWVPVVKMAMGDEPAKQGRELVKMLGLPVLALGVFFGLWSLASAHIKTSVGALPSPHYVWSQAKAMVADARAEKVNKAEFARYEEAREKFNELFKAREGAGAAAVAQLDKERADYAAELQAYVDTLDRKIEGLSGTVTAAEEAHEKLLEDTAAKLRADKKIVLDENGQPELDGYGLPKLTEKAAAKVAGLKNMRIEPYKTSLLKFYTDSRDSLTSLLGKNEKIEKCITGLAAYAAAGDEDPVAQKKMAGLERKKDAYLNQLDKPREYSGNGSISDYVTRSIVTVLYGFLLAAFVAIPLGVLCGLSKGFMMAINPLIQIFRPVSPLAWVLITIQIVDGIFVGDKALTGSMVNNPFLHSAITVALCSLWATLSNTALGVSSVSSDHMNVAQVLKLNWFDRVFKIVLPSAVPYIFTGLRITLGVGWMVLIVSEMMATSRGLGWFIDQQYQNNKVESLANIIVCIFIIGIIGALLDRIMFILHKTVSFNEDEVSA